MMQTFRCAILCCLFVAGCTATTNGQSLDSLRTVDMENLKRQPYLPAAGGINCDSTTGTIPEQRACANLELQRQDSLLQLQIMLITGELKESGREGTLASFQLGQKLWERYRYAHCSAAVYEEDMSALDMILFMQCAAQVTENRRRELESIFGEEKEKR